MKATDIIAYVYRGDIYCRDCIIDQLPTGEGEEFDGWMLGEGVRMSVEDNLDELAYAFSIDRLDESSFDSNEFPKVVFCSALGYTEFCSACHEPIEYS